MKKTTTLLCLLLSGSMLYAQYWFGPKIGLNYVNPLYQDDSFEDTYDVDNDFDFNVGLAFNYTATDMYSVYGEIVYERMNRDLRQNAPDGSLLVRSDVTNQFITVPVMLRVSLGRLPFHYYVNGGPKVSYWLASKGRTELSSFSERPPDPDTGATDLGFDYRLTFNPGKDNADDILLLSQPNRLQFGLVIGAGAFFDLISGARLMVDFRYTFGHSNFGFDDDDDVWFDFRDTDNYLETFEYTLNTASISIGYLFEYNAQLKRRGRSTNPQSNKRKK